MLREATMELATAAFDQAADVIAHRAETLRQQEQDDDGTDN